MREADVDVTVVGGGVIGLSCAYELARHGRTVALLERHERMGEETSTHNSGVIHAGIYYPNGSVKAEVCVRGKALLEERLRAWNVPFVQRGKVIVAQSDDQIPTIERLKTIGDANGATGLRLMDAKELSGLEPHIVGVAALHSPSTGVMDVGAYLRTLEARAIEAGAMVIPGARVEGSDVGRDAIATRTAAKGEIVSRALINAAGLYADDIARMCGEERFTVYPCRGEYATVIARKAHLVNGLVYPVPGTLGLGVHLTKTVDGELLAGPDARYIEGKDDYESGRRDARDFAEEARALCPELTPDDFRLGSTGIRPKIYGPGEAKADFHIATQPDDARIVHLLGIESPGLTASPAIAIRTAKLLRSALE
ncbi:NAD(P)/FAD-dependent oxidoreductase [bacterium]|nr:NAD(P)/FAD-dependent oxidoreductase [bacterium]